MKRIQIAAEKAIRRIMHQYGCSFEYAEDAVLEVLKENVDDIKAGHISIVVAVLNLL